MIRRRGGSTAIAPRDKTDDPAIRMRSNLEPSTQEVLAGLVERVTFHNTEHGWRSLSRRLQAVVAAAPVAADRVAAGVIDVGFSGGHDFVAQDGILTCPFA